MTRNYSFNAVFVYFGGQLLTEFADGDSVTVELDDDDNTATAGSHGSAMVAEKHNNLATVTFRLMQGSPLNGYLWDLRNVGRLSGLKAYPLAIRDLNGEALITADQCWIQKPPTVTLATEPGEREWICRAGNPEIRDGANLPA